MASGNIICPLCKDTVDKLVYRFHHDSEQSIIEKIKHEFPEWTVNDGACSRCVGFFNAEIVLSIGHWHQTVYQIMMCLSLCPTGFP